MKSWFKNFSRVTFLPFPSICYALWQFNLKPPQFTSSFPLVPLKCPLLITFIILTHSGIYSYSYYYILIPKMHYSLFFIILRIRSNNHACPSSGRSVRQYWSGCFLFVDKHSFVYLLPKKSKTTILHVPAHAIIFSK